MGGGRREWEGQREWEGWSELAGEGIREEMEGGRRE